MSERVGSITALLKQGVSFVFAPVIEAIIRNLHELSTSPILDFLDWDTIGDGSGPLRIYCDASKDGFGANLEQEQPGASFRPINFITRAIPDNERSWIPIDFKTGSLVWAIKRL